jgi:hypothetical protein
LTTTHAASTSMLTIPADAMDVRPASDDPEHDQPVS